MTKQTTVFLLYQMFLFSGIISSKCMHRGGAICSEITRASPNPVATAIQWQINHSGEQNDDLVVGGPQTITDVIIVSGVLAV